MDSVIVAIGKRKFTEQAFETEINRPISSSNLQKLGCCPPPPPSAPIAPPAIPPPTAPLPHIRNVKLRTSQIMPLRSLHCCDESKKNWDGQTKIPYPVIYKCSKCSKKYYCIVQDNPWFSLQYHPCPCCKLNQIPIIDIALPQNARELDPNMKLLYHEVLDEEFIDLSKAGSIPLYLDDAVLVALFPTEPSIQKACEDKVPKDLLDGNINFRLLALILHTKSCDNLHGSAKEHELCYHTKVLLLHIQQCSCTNCTFPFCQSGKRILKYLSFFPHLF